MDCHQCGACCTEISISTPYIAHSQGKPAGVPCKWNDPDTGLCDLFENPDRPAICSSFKADIDICGTNKQEATQRIRWYESQTKPKE